MSGHDDEDPVIFGYAALCNVTFRGREDSGFTWGDWRQMSEGERDEARDTFIRDRLGLAVYEEDPEDGS